MGMLACALVYVGFVLFINGIWLLGVLEDKHVIPMNLFTGVLIFAGVMRTVVWEGSNITSYFYSMQSLLFAFTYLWVAINVIWNLTGKGLGWYCLLVAIVAFPTAFTASPDLGLVILWFMWCSLWFMFFLLLGLGKNISKATGIWTVINAVVTGVAGYLILIKVWPWLPPT
jgi:putative amide transporter protein